MGADLYLIRKNPKIWGFERSERAVNDGYFRDAYNNGSILWQYKLSWWADIGKLQDESGIISVENVKKFMHMLKFNENIFEENIKDCSKEEQAYFREGARLLNKFLRDALELESPIEASL